MQGHYAESQQSEERLEEEGSVSRSSRETGPAAASDYGAHSPRPARSQISTAVSFEPAHPANSAANAARSGEDSAASAAEPDGELSSLPQEPLEGPGQQRQSRIPLAHPSGSLISTAMRPTAHTTSQPHSPPAERATSVVSKTALRRSPEAVRAGTPASVYAQDRAPGRRPLNISPHDSQALEQDSHEGRARHAMHAIHHPAGSTAPGGHAEHPQHSEWQEASVRHYDGAASQPPDSHASRPVPELQQNSQEGMQEGLSAEGRNNSIEAVQQGDLYQDDMAPAASAARSMPGMGSEQQLAGLPSVYQAAIAALAHGTALERSASAGSERNGDLRSNADEAPLDMLAAAFGQSLQQSQAQAWLGTGQSSWATGQGSAEQPAAGLPVHASAAQAAPGGFNVPALPAHSPFLSLASRYPAVLDAVLRSDTGLAAPALAQTVRQGLSGVLFGAPPAAQHGQGAQAERVASTRLPLGIPSASLGLEGTPPRPHGGSNELLAVGSNGGRASQHSVEDLLQQRLYTAGSLAQSAEGELRDPNLAQGRHSPGSPPMEQIHRPTPQQLQFDSAGPAQSAQQLGWAAAGQEAHSGAAAQGRPTREPLHGADSGAMPALSVIRGLSGPVPASPLPGHVSSAQRRAQAAAAGAVALHPIGDRAHGNDAALQQEKSLAHSLAAQPAGLGGHPQDETAHADQAPPQDTAHAAASVHATVMSEEDAMSEGETHLSSRRARASRSVANLRSAAAPGAYIEERQESHHTAGLAQEEREHKRAVVGTPMRQELARPIDSTTAMAAAGAPTLSCEQSVEMCPHGSPSAEAVAQHPATNSADSSPACDPASKPSRDAGQGINTAPARLHRTGVSGVHVEGGGRALPNGLSRHQGCPEGGHREVYDAGPQNSNGTTIGQVMAAGPQSAQPEGSLGSHAAVEQLQPLADREASVAERRPTEGAMPAASANVATSLPLGCPPLHRAAQPGSSSMRTRPAAPPFALGPGGADRDAGAAPQSGGALQRRADKDPPRYTGSSPLQAPPVRCPHQAMAHGSPPARDADAQTGAVSGGQPAHATVMAGALSARGSPVPGHELQSQPISRTDSHQDPAPQPALTVIMPSGCLPHVSEGRGESQPAGHSPEFQSHNLRSGAVLNGQPGQGGPGRANKHENQAQSHRARPGAHHSNGHAARTEGALGVHDVLSGEDSAPDTGRAVTSPAPGSAPGRRRSSIGKRKRVNGGAADQPRSRYSATKCS